MTDDETATDDGIATDETAADETETEQPNLPPLPKVELPPINRKPVSDRSNASYLANTPGIDAAGSAPDAVGESGVKAPSPWPAPRRGDGGRGGDAADATGAAAQAGDSSDAGRPSTAEARSGDGDRLENATGAEAEPRASGRRTGVIVGGIIGAVVVVGGGVAWLLVSGVLG